MSTYDDASLILIPSGVKDGKVYSAKPTNGDGDFTFTRASEATRLVDGVVTKVRTNSLLQSNSFDTTWESNQVNRESVVSSGESGYDGTSNAWLLLDTTGSGFHQIVSGALTTSGVCSAAVYAKAYSSSRYLGLAGFGLGGGSEMPVFDLDNGTVDMPSTSSILKDATITSVGNGWYRCSMMFLYSGSSSLSITLCNSATNNGIAGYTYTGTGSNGFYIQSAQLEQGTVATDYIATTTVAVSEGPVANMPRLNSVAGGCPSLLLEPQRTNLITYSEYFGASYWTKSGATIVDNATTSPDGYVNASQLVEDLANTMKAVKSATITVAASSLISASFYVKPDTITKVMLRDDLVGGYVSFNLTTKVVISELGAATGTIETLSDGWIRITLHETTQASGAYKISLYMLPDSYVSGDRVSYIGTSRTISIYGAQSEVGSYATSYIPNYGTTAGVTRVADACSKTGVSSLIGQTEGTIYAEYNFDASIDNSGGSDRDILSMTDGTFSNSIQIVHYGNGVGSAYKKVYLYVRVSSSYVVTISSSQYNSGLMKVACGYKNNDYVLYVNGVQIGTDTSAGVPACSQIDVGKSTIATTTEINQALLYDTRLTNAELETLTTL